MAKYNASRTMYYNSQTMNNTYLKTNLNRSYLTEDVIPFKGDVLAFRKHQNVIEKRFLYIYKITCLKDNRVYIGKRIAPLNCDDPLKDTYKGSGHVLKSLKNKYDWMQDFKFEIVKFCANEESLNLAEIELISIAREKYGNLCCNLYDGGNGMSPLNAMKRWQNLQYAAQQSQRRSELNKQMWQDPYYREIWTQHSREMMQSPERKEASRQIMQKNWQNDEWCEQRSIERKQRWLDPNYRQVISESVSKSQKQYWQNNPQRKQQLIDQTKCMWQNPEFRQKQSDKMKKQAKEWWQDSANKKSNSEKSKAAWDRDPQRRQEQALRMKALNEKRWHNDNARSIQAQNMSSMVNQKWNDGTMLQIHGRRVLVEESFTSPLNNIFFEKGTVFKSIKDAAAAVGYKDGPTFGNNVLRNKKHPGIWIARINGKDQYITKFKILEK